MADQPNKHVNQPDMAAQHTLWYELILHRHSFTILTIANGRFQYVPPAENALYGYRSGTVQFTANNSTMRVYGSRLDRSYHLIGNGARMVGAIRISDDNGVLIQD